MEGKFPSKILVFVTDITHNCDSFSYWSQIFYILPSICEDFILPSQIRFFESAFWVRQKFLVANRHFSCSNLYKNKNYDRTQKKENKKERDSHSLIILQHIIFISLWILFNLLKFSQFSTLIQYLNNFFLFSSNLTRSETLSL